MREHISTVVKHFRGKVFSWDVVNEAIADDQGYLRQSKWLNRLGEEFIAEAFLAAHAADPDAELYYIMITELDLDVLPRGSGADVGAAGKPLSGDPYAEGCPPEVLQRRAEQYAALFALFNKHADKICSGNLLGPRRRQELA